MKIYTVVLADDEPNILDGMNAGIPWEELGFQVVATAENGREALDLVKLHHPDLVMSDIRMPFMDGLSLAETIHKKFMNVKVVLFSGFEDFDYAQQAIRSGVSEYILKPIDFDEMSSLLGRLHEELDQYYEEKAGRKRLEEIYQESLPILQQRFCDQLFRHEMSQEELQRKTENLEVSFDPDKVYTAALIRIYENQELPQGQAGDILPGPDAYILDTIARNVIKDMFDQVGQPYVFTFGDDLACIFEIQNSGEVSDIMRSLEECGRTMEKMFHATFSGGLGTVVSQPGKLVRSAEQAKEALAYNLADRSEYVTYYRDLDLAEVSEEEPDWLKAAEELFHAIQHEDDAMIESDADKLFARIEKCRFPISRCQIIMIQIVLRMTELLARYQIEEEEKLASSKDMTMKILSMDNATSLRNWLVNYCRFIQNTIKSKKTGQHSLLVSQAVSYCEENLGNPDLSVEHMAVLLSVSESHFSRIFREETGKTFVTWLTGRRMDLAVHLLLTTDEKTSVIGNTVGYPEPNYFSYVFKKNMKESPVHYRREHRLQGGES